MNINLTSSVSSVLVLGAGASADYGLPVWSQLSSLIREKIEGDKINQYLHKKEIMAWTSKVGVEYETIDKCIEIESTQPIHHSDAHTIEDELFSIIKIILEEKYKINEGHDWIKILNEKILNSGNQSLADDLFFINYNYDNVLDKHFLNFDHYGIKLRLKNKTTLNQMAGVSVDALYPNGNFYISNDSRGFSRIQKFYETHKDGIEEYKHNTISCLESYSHTVSKNNRLSGFKLYILGLGGGLKHNLSKINFLNPISKIHVTIMDSNLEQEIINFLVEQYRIQVSDIIIYKTCDELIKECF